MKPDSMISRSATLKWLAEKERAHEGRFEEKGDQPRDGKKRTENEVIHRCHCSLQA
ncbi:hypothetical protein [Yoonia sp.]|uniref:hypothetical protein n=1 Tax=Yoonia sp. TaxID=2212373 RepID=UPI00397675D4